VKDSLHFGVFFFLCLLKDLGPRIRSVEVFKDFLFVGRYRDHALQLSISTGSVIRKLLDSEHHKDIDLR
jgi:hypothetical protein